VKIAEKYDSFMGVHMPIKYSTNESRENMDAVLVLKPMKLVFLTWLSKEVYRTYLFSQIKRWGLSHDRYMLLMTTDDVSHMIETPMAETLGWYIATSSSFFLKNNFVSVSSTNDEKD
jgi:hypothetical protein